MRITVGVSLLNIYQVYTKYEDFDICCPLTFTHKSRVFVLCKTDIHKQVSHIYKTHLYRQVFGTQELSENSDLKWYCNVNIHVYITGTKMSSPPQGTNNTKYPLKTKYCQACGTQELISDLKWHCMYTLQEQRHVFSLPKEKKIQNIPQNKILSSMWHHRNLL